MKIESSAYFQSMMDVQNQDKPKSGESFQSYMYSSAAQTSAAQNSNPFAAAGMSVSEEISTMFIKEQEAMYYRTNDPEQLKADFTAIVQKAVDQNAFSDPKTFMKNLSPEERDVIKLTNSYGVDLTNNVIDDMSVEGAYNMIVPSHMQLDMDKNGLTAVGQGQMFKFPSSNASSKVKEAWEEFTEDMTPKELMEATMPMVTKYLSHNLPIEMNGGTADDYTDPFNTGDFSYMDWARERLEANEYFKGQISNEQYEKEKAYFTKFMEVFGRHGVK